MQSTGASPNEYSSSKRPGTATRIALMMIDVDVDDELDVVGVADVVDVVVVVDVVGSYYVWIACSDRLIGDRALARLCFRPIHGSY